MTPNHRLLRTWTTIGAVGLSLLLMASAALRWPLIVQFALVAFAVAAGYGTERVGARLRRRR
jgi:hypothetical protein